MDSHPTPKLAGAAGKAMPHICVSAFTVNYLSDSAEDASRFAVHVVLADGGWAVRDWQGQCFAEDGRPVPDNGSSSQTEEWLYRYRQPTAEAGIALARQVAATLSWAGMTVSEVLEAHPERASPIDIAD